MYYLQVARTQVRQIATTISDNVEQALGPAIANTLRQAADYAVPLIGGGLVAHTALSNVDPTKKAVMAALIAYAIDALSEPPHAAAELATNPQPGGLDIIGSAMSYLELQSTPSVYEKLLVESCLVMLRIDSLRVMRRIENPYVNVPVRNYLRPQAEQMPM